MLTEEHFDMLTRFRVRAMGDKLREMVEDDSYDSYTFEERMEMLIEAEATARRDRKVAKLVRVFITHLKLHQSRTKVSAVTEKNFHQSRKRHVQQIDWLSLGRSLTPQRKARKGNARHADHSEYTKQKSQRRDPLPNRGA